jgi:hypothetical protein
VETRNAALELECLSYQRLGEAEDWKICIEVLIAVAAFRTNCAKL